MFDNIGGKIKTTAEVICWIGIAVSVIGGISLLFASGISPGTSVMFVISGIAVMVIGSLASWVGSFVLYGFGELIDNTSLPRYAPAPVSPKETAQAAARARTEQLAAKKVTDSARLKCGAFTPMSVDLTPDANGSSIVLYITNDARAPLQAVKTDVRLTNVFGDETLFRNVCFAFSGEGTLLCTSLPGQISLPACNIPLIASCAVTIHTYVPTDAPADTSPDMLRKEAPVDASPAMLRKDAPADAPSAPQPFSGGTAAEVSATSASLFRTLSILADASAMLAYIKDYERRLPPALYADLTATLEQCHEHERQHGRDRERTITAVKRVFAKHAE